MTSEQYTAFVPHRGVLEHNGMPCGAMNSPMILQQVMNRVFEETYTRVCGQDCWYGRHAKDVEFVWNQEREPEFEGLKGIVAEC
ncbi:RNA-directed DNA polymerase [Gregarina niphandrodes]|uniref:RNA-directed DNA polymerase n=1 Tax=Gregarina niphandrodes TaxID=110365 RepID=A0A023AXG1_GRENI|nr:RNA-directed DNA polymerase [Gregarina niphandrodes]EZG42950.1 RNA-directed DNA polymerase [Gregarina niphandrodes]|eukprot:XP_011133774.1 RNA-directed DNA polymerase [Gregarina niphandrodes]